MSEPVPTYQHAIKVLRRGVAVVVSDVAVPTIRPNEVLVKVKAVALNPTDWKHVEFLASPGATVGCDYAGTVVKVGREVTKEVQIGDRIAGFVHGSTRYAMKMAHSQNNLSWEDAATLGVGNTTVGLALHGRMQLPWPQEDLEHSGKWIFIHGGATATGTLAIQFAKLSGFKVIATSSPHNYGLLRRYGADTVFDYHEDFATQIREFTANKLRYAFDCHAKEGSAIPCIAAISESGGAFCTLEIFTENPTNRSDIHYSWVMAYTVFGEDYHAGPGGRVIAARREDYELGKRFWQLCEHLFAEGKIKAYPTRVEGSGLEGVLTGLGMLRENRVSGQKLVYTLDE